MKNTIKPNELNTEKFYKLLDKFIIESKKGIRLRTNGKRMGKDSIQNYQTFKRLLLDFERDEGFKIKLYRVNKLDEEELKLISKYWKTFFVSFNFLSNSLIRVKKSSLRMLCSIRLKISSILCDDCKISVS